MMKLNTGEREKSMRIRTLSDRYQNNRRKMR